jgi:UTP--glucose-1-phosphate uridylyltransferase
MVEPTVRRNADASAFNGRSRVRKAVFPVAGLGTRFLPATKSIPKEMLTVVDRPLIQYAVEEALAAGIEQIVFVTGRGKSALEDHFDISFELETVMTERGKSLAPIGGTRLPPGAIVYVRQQQPLGLGHAVLCAREIIGDEPFAVILPDELMVGTPSVTAQLVSAYQAVGGNVIGAIEVDRHIVSRYGIIKPGPDRHGLTSVAGLIEKPTPALAPSCLAIAGRYILQPEIMTLLADQPAGVGGEIQLTDAIARLIATQPCHALAFHGERYDCGDKAGWLMANIALGLTDPETRDTLGTFLQRLPHQETVKPTQIMTIAG